MRRKTQHVTDRAQAWRDATPQGGTDRVKDWRDANEQKVRDAMKAWRDANRQKRNDRANASRALMQCEGLSTPHATKGHDDDTSNNHT